MMGAILEEAKHQGGKKNQRRPKRCVIDEMQTGEQQTGEQVGNSDRPQRVATDIVTYQFLYQAAKNNFLDNRVEQYG